MEIKKPSLFRLAISLPLLVFGIRLILISGFGLFLNRLEYLIFGLVYILSGSIISMPLFGRVTIPASLNDQKPFWIAFGLCVTVFLLPFLGSVFSPGSLDKFSETGTRYGIILANLFALGNNRFIFSSYENGLILSILFLVFSIGLNVRLERGKHYKGIFIMLVLSVSLICIIIFIAFISIVSRLA